MLHPQGDYDQARTKVLHMTVNPASEAQQSRRQDQARLREECERLRKLVGALERGGPVPADLQATGLPSSEEVAGRPLAVPGVRPSRAVTELHSHPVLCSGRTLGRSREEQVP